MYYSQITCGRAILDSALNTKCGTYSFKLTHHDEREHQYRPDAEHLRGSPHKCAVEFANCVDDRLLHFLALRFLLFFGSLAH